MTHKKEKKAPVRLDVAAVAADPQEGLTHAQVKERVDGGWTNRVSDDILPGEGQIILSHILTFFNFVFVALALILVLAGSTVTNMTFLIVVVINTVIGCIQQIRAKRAVEKLTLVAAQTVKTVRQGSLVEVREYELVRDDVVCFGPGDQICADAVVCVGELRVNESLLTGEADAVLKLPGDELLGGSFVVTGSARVRLTRVGNDAYAAKLSREAKKDPRAAKSEMMRALDRLIRVMSVILVPVGLVLFWQEFSVLQQGMQASAEKTVAALVGMIPEGLYLLTSVALAASAIKLTQKRVLVQDMNCIETLARVDVLCVDKTGTITEPEMEVQELISLASDPPEAPEAVLAALYSGEPENNTAAALGRRFGGKSHWECIRRIPFASEEKWSGAVFRDRGAYLSGAPEVIMGSRYEEIRGAVEELTARGSRVLLCAGYAGDPQPGKLDTGLVTPLGLITLTNRIRPAAPETFRYFAQQGVTVKVISGDNPAAVSQVAARAGIAGAENYVDARTLETEEQIARAAEDYGVFGRVTPEMKRALIRAMKEKHTVAMTGDGVNDVLAMRESDCAIAMASGAQAASQASRLVLLDSDFSAMPHIVGEGRRVINNIQRAAALYLVKNIFSLTLALISLLTHYSYPLQPINLTLVSALTIGIPSFFLALEPNYDRVRGSFLPGVLRRAFPGGLTDLLVVLLAQACAGRMGLDQTQLGTVCTVVLGAVGLLVLLQVSRPLKPFRLVILCLMAAFFVGALTLLGPIFQVDIYDLKTVLLSGGMVCVAVAVFAALQMLFNLGDKLYEKLVKGRC